MYQNIIGLCWPLQDFKKDPQKVVNQKLLLDRVGEENCATGDMVTKHFERHSLDAPGFTPWFDVWMKLYLQSLPTMEHEYLKHHFGCLFVVSTAHANPVEQFRWVGVALFRRKQLGLRVPTHNKQRVSPPPKMPTQVMVIRVVELKNEQLCFRDIRILQRPSGYGWHKNVSFFWICFIFNFRQVSLKGVGGGFSSYPFGAYAQPWGRGIWLCGGE